MPNNKIKSSKRNSFKSIRRIKTYSISIYHSSLSPSEVKNLVSEVRVALRLQKFSAYISYKWFPEFVWVWVYQESILNVGLPCVCSLYIFLTFHQTTTYHLKAVGQHCLDTGWVLHQSPPANFHIHPVSKTGVSQFHSLLLACAAWLSWRIILNKYSYSSQTRPT